MDYPEIIKIRFRPTPEMCRFRGHGIDTLKKLVWEVPREDGIYLIRYYSNNWAIDKDVPDPATPLVSAVMPTCPGREKMARYAVEQFKNQTWPNKELVIVNEGTEWITDGTHNNIREVRVQPGHKNGALHNIGDGIAKGDYIIRWDDDDIHHPDRIRLQVQSVMISGGPCSTLGKRIHYILEDDIAFIKPATSVGLILYRNEGKRYEEGVGGGSDEMFFNYFYRGKTTKLDNWPGLYVRIFHGVNQICSKTHCMAGTKLQPGEWEVGDCEEYLREEIKKYREAIA